MLIDERHSEILTLIKEKTYISVDELAKRVYASPATIRRDLADLENAGLIQRVRGGASIIGTSTGEVSSLVRRQTNVQEKRRMADEAFQFIQDGHSYFFDSSTSVGQLIPLLSKTNDITVITNGLENGYFLCTIPSCRSYIVGGQIQSKAASSIGADALSFVSSFHCDAFLFSCHGFSLQAGASEGTIEQQRIKEAMIKNSTTHILVADHSKFGTTFVASVCPLSQIDIVITDQDPSEEFKKAFEENNIRLIVAR